MTNKMRQAVLDYPDGLPQLLKISELDFIDEVRFLAAAKLYELGRLSSGKAAQMAGMERVNFLYELSRYGFSALHLDEEEAQAEVEAAQRLAQ